MLIINTGGTFNKKYNPLKGELEVAQNASVIQDLLSNFPNLKYNLVSILHIDSLDMNDSHREQISQIIQNSHESKVLIIHGTDTMDKTAKFLEGKVGNKTVVITGAMVPFSINPIEASCNFATSIGFLLGNEEKGIFIGMHGLVNSHEKVYKNRNKGVFELI